jgi:hypothetical protein
MHHSRLSTFVLDCKVDDLERNSHGSPASPTVTPAPRRCSWDPEIDDCGGDRRRAARDGGRVADVDLVERLAIAAAAAAGRRRRLGRAPGGRGGLLCRLPQGGSGRRHRPAVGHDVAKVGDEVASTAWRGRFKTRADARGRPCTSERPARPDSRWPRRRRRGARPTTANRPCAVSSGCTPGARASCCTPAS